MQRKIIDIYDLNREKDKLKNSSKSSLIYVVRTRDENIVKIGRTSNIWKRLNRLQMGTPKKLDLLMFWMCFDISKVESALHTIFHPNRLHGEWFEFGSNTYKSNIWKYQLIAEIAMKTTLRLPIPIDSGLCSFIQYSHIPDSDPCWDEPGGSNLDGKEFYSPEVFADFKHDMESGKTRVDVSIEKKIENFWQDYGLT